MMEFLHQANERVHITGAHSLKVLPKYVETVHKGQTWASNEDR